MRNPRIPEAVASDRRTPQEAGFRVCEQVVGQVRDVHCRSPLEADMKARFVTFGASLLLLLLTRAADGAPRDDLIVSTSWLLQHANESNLVLLHIGDKTEYDAAHIPGALRRDARSFAAAVRRPEPRP